MAARYGVRLDACCAVNQPIRADFGTPCAWTLGGKIAVASTEPRNARRFT
jgi:hypothetical protein